MKIIINFQLHSRYYNKISKMFGRKKTKKDEEQNNEEGGEGEGAEGEEGA